MSDNKQPTQHKIFWKDCWERRYTPWNIGKPHPMIPRLFKILKDRKFETANKLILDPGCGHGYNAHAFAEAGMRVQAIDIEPQAIALAQELHSHDSIDFKVKDIECIDDREKYDFVFERAMWMAFPPKTWEPYLFRISNFLKPEGVFFGVVFLGSTTKKGPPYSLSEKKFDTLTKNSFQKLAFEEYEPYWAPTNNLIKQQAVFVLRKK